MSTSTRRMPLQEAEFQAALLSAAIEDVVERQVWAGSIRRQCENVGDIDHVIIPKIIDVPDVPETPAPPPPPGLFGESLAPAAPVKTKSVSALRMRVEQLIRDGTCGAALSIKSDGKNRFGPKYISLTFNGVCHELWGTVPEHWGNTLLVRTGSDKFSHWFVTELRKLGLRMDQARLLKMPVPDGQGGMSEESEIHCPDEETLFRMAGMSVVPPEKRER